MSRNRCFVVPHNYQQASLFWGKHYSTMAFCELLWWRTEESTSWSHVSGSTSIFLLYSAFTETQFACCVKLSNLAVSLFNLSLQNLQAILESFLSHWIRIYWEYVMWEAMCQRQERSNALTANELDHVTAHPIAVWCSRSPGEVDMSLFLQTKSQLYDWSHGMARTQKPKVFLLTLPTLSPPSIKSGIQGCLFTLPKSPSSPFSIPCQSLVWSLIIDAMEYFNICTVVASVSFLPSPCNIPSSQSEKAFLYWFPSFSLLWPIYHSSSSYDYRLRCTMLPRQSLITFHFSPFHAFLHSDFYPGNSNLTSSEKSA